MRSVAAVVILVVLGGLGFIFAAFLPFHASAQITIRDATWGVGPSKCNISSYISDQCSGKNSCSGIADHSLYGCSDPKWGYIKELIVDYECGESQFNISANQYSRWRISCDNLQQPTVVVHARIIKNLEHGVDEGSFDLYLPSDYEYCWAKFWNFWSISSSATVTPNGNGITVLWYRRGGSGPGSARAGFEYLFAVAGTKPGEDCPPSLQ
jgi:hypothetical protein